MDIFGILTALGTFIETVIINGILGSGFNILKNLFLLYAEIAPFLEGLFALFGV